MRLVVYLVHQVVGLQDLRVGMARMGGHRRRMQCVVAVLVVLVGVGGRRRGVLGVVDLSVNFVAVRTTDLTSYELLQILPVWF